MNGHEKYLNGLTALGHGNYSDVSISRNTLLRIADHTRIILCVCQKAAEWLLAAAEQDRHPGAQCEFGHMCEEGRGVPLSDEQAVLWYRRSADQV